MLSKLTDFAGRLAVAPILIVGAKSALDNAEALAPMIKKQMEQVGLSDLPVEASSLVKFNAYAQMAGAAALSLGMFKRTAAAGLATSLALTTVAGHQFWSEETEEAANAQKLHFFKNLAMIGYMVSIAGSDK